jgi:hypothetical protein
VRWEARSNNPNSAEDFRKTRKGSLVCLDRVESPSCRRLKQSGQAITTLTDRSGARHDVVLGKYCTAQSRKECARVISEWETAGRCLPQHSAEGPPKSDLTINELCWVYWRHAERTYVKEGKTSSETLPSSKPSATSANSCALA